VLHAQNVLISVDIETSGPNPSDYAMLSLGACRVDRPDVSFYVELRPDRPGIDADAVKISGLDPARLRLEGLEPRQALLEFEAWLLDQVPPEGKPLFVAFNAPFDWMFVADYFHRYLGRNPFGHSALDIKALFMGAFGVAWDQTTMAHAAQKLGLPTRLSHHALQDARQQAELFKALIAASASLPEEENLDG